MSKQVSVSPEQVLAAAAKCPSAKTILKTLFPEVFEEEKKIDLSLLFDKGYEYSVFTPEKAKKANFLDTNGYPAIQVRAAGEYENKGFFLGKGYDWEIKKEAGGTLVLVPTRK